MILSKFSINLPRVSELPEEQIASARNLNTLIQASVLETINSVNNPNVENDFEKKGLIVESNFFTENINAVIFHLENVIGNLEADDVEDKQDLVQLVAKLVQSSYAVLNEINKNPQDLKTQLKANLQQVATVSVDLLKIMEKNKLRENGQTVFLALGALLRAIDYVKIQNEVLNESPDNIKDFLKKDVKIICNATKTISLQNDKRCLYRIIDSVNHHCEHLESIVDVFLKQHGDGYASDIRELMTDTCRDLHDTEVEFQKLYTEKNDVESLKTLVSKNVDKICEIIAKLVCALEIGEDVGTAGECLTTTDEDGPPAILSRTTKVRH